MQLSNLIYNILGNIIKVLLPILSVFSKRIYRFEKAASRSFKATTNFKAKEKSDILWMHCASVGEFEQGKEVLSKLLKSLPQFASYVTFFSSSGTDFYEENTSIKCCLLPIDTRKNAVDFISILDPKIVLWVNNEIWPNYLSVLEKKEIPVFHIASQLKGDYLKYKFFKNALASIQYFYPVDLQTQNFLLKLGIDNAAYLGNPRIDTCIKVSNENPDIKTLDMVKLPIIIYGSIWKEDIKILKSSILSLTSYQHLLYPHQLDSKNILKLQSILPEMKNINYIINPGELKYAYRFADIIYIGGGFGKGIHNILEGIVYGKPIILGTNYQKFIEAKELVKKNIAFSIKTEEEFIKCIEYISKNKSSISEKALKFVKGQQGATNRIVNHILNQIH